MARSPVGARFEATVIWDGRELLELGGTAGGKGGGSPLDTSAAYSPATSSWTRVADVPASLDPVGAASVWTGRQVFLFPGSSLPREPVHDVAGLYDPATNAWTVTSKAPVGPLNQATAVWTGSTVVLAGMSRGTPRLQVASYDPATDRWAKLAPPLPRDHPTESYAIVTTNDGILLWSLWGRTKQISRNEYQGLSGIDLDRLTPSGQWIQIPHWPLHGDLGTPIFTGTQVVLPAEQPWCGTCPGPMVFDTHGYLLNARTLRLTGIPHGPLDDIAPQVIWTGHQELELNTGGEIGGHENVRPGDTATWNPATGRWTRGPPAPLQLGDEPAVWTGNELLALSENGHLLAYTP